MRGKVQVYTVLSILYIQVVNPHSTSPPQCSQPSSFGGADPRYLAVEQICLALEATASHKLPLYTVTKAPLSLDACELATAPRRSRSAAVAFRECRNHPNGVGPASRLFSPKGGVAMAAGLSDDGQHSLDTHCTSILEFARLLRLPQAEYHQPWLL